MPVRWKVALSDSEFQLSSFSSLIPLLKESLKNGKQVDHKNFYKNLSKISSLSLITQHFSNRLMLRSLFLFNYHISFGIAECRVLLMENIEDIAVPLPK